MTSTRIVATVAATAVALTSLTACSGTDEAGNQSTAASKETVVSTETVTSEQTSAPAPTGAGVANTGGNTGELPRAVTGYTDEARAEMAEDGLTEADVQAVLDAAHAGDAEVEWDDDGYWELEWHNIDVDITPDGLVREADR